MKRKIFISGCLMMVFAGCSLNPHKDNVSVKIDIRDSGAAYSVIESPTNLMNSFDTFTMGSSTVPSSIDGFDCLAINIMGYGIEPNMAGFEHEFSSGFAFDVNSLLPGLIAGEHACNYPGIYSELFPVSAGSVSVELVVPSGTQRVIQVVGYDSNIGCPSGDFSQIMQQYDMETAFNSVYQVGHAVQDLFSDTTVSISNSYDPNSPMDVMCDIYGSSTSTYPGSFASDVHYHLMAASIGGYADHDMISANWVPDTGSGDLTSYTNSSFPKYRELDQIGGNSAVEFGGVSSEFKSSSINLGNSLTEFTLVFVARMPHEATSTPAGMIAAYNADGITAPTGEYVKLYADNTKFKATIGQGGVEDQLVLPSSGAFNTNLFYTHVIRFDGSTFMYENDDESDGTATAITNVNLDYGLSIASLNGGTFGDIYVAEVAFYQRALSDDEVYDMIAYMRTKYNLYDQSGGVWNIKDDTATEFNGSGTRSGMNFDGTWFGLDATGQTTGIGWYESNVFRPTDKYVDITGVFWEPDRPYQMPLPEYGNMESGYYVPASNANMANNVLYLHMDAFPDFDVSGNSIGVAAPSGWPSTTPGKFGDAADIGSFFHLRATDTAALDLSTGEFSVEFWMQATSVGGSYYGLFDKGEGPSRDFGAWINPSNYIEFQTDGFSNSNTGTTVTATTATNIGQWYHVVMVKKASVVELYINGSLDNSVGYTGGGTNNSNDLLVGARWSSATPSDAFSGYIDEFAVHNVALDPTTILERFYRGAMKIEFQARTCTANDCSDQTSNWYGPGGGTGDIVHATQYFADPRYDPGVAEGLWGLTIGEYVQYKLYLYSDMVPGGSPFPSPRVKYVELEMSEDGGGALPTPP